MQPPAIVCWEQTIVWWEQIIVWRQQTIVWRQQTMQRRDIDESLATCQQGKNKLRPSGKCHAGNCNRTLSTVSLSRT